MSRCSDRTRALILGLIGALVGAQVPAQTAESPSAKSIKNMQDAAAAAKGPAAAPRDPSVSSSAPLAGRRPVLRCWQDGKLVFEGAGVSPGAQAQAAIELRTAAGGGVALQVFDLKNGLCLLDYGREP